MPYKVHVKMSDTKKLRGKVRNGGDNLLGDPMEQAMDLIGWAGEDEAKAAANTFRRSGLNASSIRHSVAPTRPFPQWVKIEAFARRKSKRYPRGYAYPRMWNYAPMWKRGKKRLLNPHQNWLTDALLKVQPKAQKLLEVVGRAIELKWRN